MDCNIRVGDYFEASTDTMFGSSGGGAFDSDLFHTGVMGRGSSSVR